MSHTHHAVFESLLVSAALTLATLVYVRGLVRTRRVAPDTIEPWRAISFLLGLSFIWLAMASPIAALDHELLTVHMVQHLLLMTLAPPLIWLGAPMKTRLQGLPQGSVRVARSCFRSTALQRLGRAIAQPTVCWLAAAGTLVGWHVPAAFMLGMRSEVWHGIEQASFLGAGLLFWWPVVWSNSMASNRSGWSILLYLFLATLPCDILSGLLVFCDRVVYPVYFSSGHMLGFSALEDQQCAGALMWTCVTVVYLMAGTIFTARLLLPDRSRQYWLVKSGPQLGTAAQTTPRTMEVV
ncbi:MAG TPA: cytochrome c oxidase assembly protein [Dongiaceae bacterium]|nr:cytochrome c oxidase assembly protein [Dongiaceae bacterium]